MGDRSPKDKQKKQKQSEKDKERQKAEKRGPTIHTPNPAATPTAA